MIPIDFSSVAWIALYELRLIGFGIMCRPPIRQMETPLAVCEKSRFYISFSFVILFYINVFDTKYDIFLLEIIAVIERTYLSIFDRRNKSYKVSRNIEAID
jgi:hypothetical protein